ncbi:RdgB/HAM1 family non-canonical purine NTP pyrophosphatase [Microlunatus ginsengisoli]|uniref:RdgB/HAM1 family non-canonical purine NTP pyrophosphatase n=1 Tax=Microlunatus ginsengisoli TaxID=363863 RepID=UPI0031DD803B
MTRVVLATTNAKKLLELRRILAAAAAAEDRAGAANAIEILGLADVPGYPEPAETESTFEGNALLKARICARSTGLPALADDSGLSVEVLNGMPGVRSARWAGPQASDDDNNELLLRQLSDVPAERRAARFVCAVALVLPDGTEHVRRGEMPGALISELRGHNGFGYDPMFVALGQERSNGELTSEEKDAISHRAQALRAIAPVLIDELATS